jgi:O-antigen/teichoic acid export membrane protein
MTRLLAPEMFGLMAIATTVMIGLTMFSDVGLKQNVVQSRRGDDQVFLDTAWTIQIVRGFLICGGALAVCIAIAIAGHAGLFPATSVYSAPELPYVVGAISISAAISGFESTKLFQASRRILLREITWLEILAQAIGLTFMLAWVAVDRSIWALVAGSLASCIARTVLSHTILPGTPNHFHWDRSAVQEVLHFGKWILIASIVGFLVNCGDRLLLGALVDASVLGYYAIACLFVGAVEGILSKIMAEVAFPALSEVVRTRRSELKASYYKFLTIIGGSAYLMSGALMISGQSLISVLYDHRYQEAGWMLAALSISLLALPFRLITQSFLALGMPQLESRVVIIRLVVLFAATPLGFYLAGIQGALAGIVASYFSSVPVAVLYNVRHGLFDLRRELYLFAYLPAGMVLGKVVAVVLDYWKGHLT